MMRVISEITMASSQMQIASRSLIPANHVTQERLRLVPRPGELLERAEADRRDADPPIPVDTATWSNAGQLDWWVKDPAGMVGSRTRCGRSATVGQSCRSPSRMGLLAGIGH